MKPMHEMTLDELKSNIVQLQKRPKKTAKVKRLIAAYEAWIQKRERENEAA